jgi:hypothetical protein
VLDEQKPQFTHKSDLWAAGILILWCERNLFSLAFWRRMTRQSRQMLFWACETNLQGSQYQTSRFFPFHLLKDDKHDYVKLKTAFPFEKFKLVVQRVLRNNYKKHPEKEFLEFNQLCDIFEAMCVENPSTRPACVEFLSSFNYFVAQECTQPQ